MVRQGPGHHGQQSPGVKVADPLWHKLFWRFWLSWLLLATPLRAQPLDNVQAPVPAVASVTSMPPALDLDIDNMAPAVSGSSPSATTVKPEGSKPEASLPEISSSEGPASKIPSPEASLPEGPSSEVSAAELPLPKEPFSKIPSSEASRPKTSSPATSSSTTSLPATSSSTTSLPATSSPETSSPAKSSAARLAVIAAYQAMTQRLGSSLAVTIPQAQGDVLAMYPEYWWLRHQVQTLPRVEWPIFQLQHFLKRYRGTYLADALRIDWLLAAAKAGDFETVDSIAFVKNSDAQFKCAKLEARVRSGHPVTAAQALQTFAPGTWCWSLYNQLVARRVLGWHELKTPLRDAIEHDSVTKARQYASYLFEPSQQQAFETLLRNPMLWLLKQRRPPRGQANIELVTLALARLGRVDLSVADRTLRRRWAKNLPKQNVAWIRTQFALVAALKLDPRAHDWYKEAGHIRMSPYNAQWRVRAALRRPKIDWQWVITAIERMDKETQTHPDWVYWRARGLAALGAHEQARRHYAKIANRFTFYGQLAAEELGRRVVMPPQASPVTDQELKLARAHPGLQRAIALFRLGWREQALSEWRYALQGKNDRQKLAIAALAHQEQLHDRVINTSIHTQQQFDVTQRYIVPFEGRITAKAKQVGLDSAWVHGLIRQESYFHLEARSSAGAAGLMQLMPGTAKWIARKIGWASFSLGKVTDFEVNTHLGMVYLHRVLQELDGSQVLASAGYNAGASRPRRWRAALTHVMEGAIFAETIPFTETRNYVKNVMAHATCYAVLFSGRPQSLKQRLGQITPQPLLRPSVYQPYRPPYRESL